MLVTRLQDQRNTASLAAQFNDFYLQITLPEITQIGNYKILREIGEGAFGKVYLAEHVLLKSRVVLKCGLLEDPNIVREIYYHRQLRHRNIVKLYEVVKTETQLWMVMEYCEGNELYYHIYEKRRLDAESARNIFYQIVEGIRYVHSLNLAHRDLKLENILMADKKKSIVKLTDFGFVREFNPTKRTFLSTVCGTTSYMAPEMLQSNKYSGFAVDIWAMGVVLYAMVYGQLPFDADDDMATKIKIVGEEPFYLDAVPREINTLLQKMLSKDPMNRPSISEILNSDFLIDVTNLKTDRRSLVLADSESFVSINQYFKAHEVPFQSRMEKELIKKLAKLNLDIDTLQLSKLCGDMNALTAFYELALRSEFERKKQRQVKKTRYYEAKRQLKRSKKRVKSVLSLSDQMSVAAPPLERIISSLSIGSNKTDYLQMLSTMARHSSSEFRYQGSQIPTRERRGSSFLEASENGKATPVPLSRSISFYPDEGRSISNVSRSQEEPNSKRKQLLKKLNFWKKNKGDSEAKLDSSTSPSLKNPSKSFDAVDPNDGRGKPNDEITVLLNGNAVHNAELMDREEVLQSQSELNRPDVLLESAPSSQVTPSQESYSRRHRPDSVISQFSQLSQTSQMYTMSESEMDLGTDMDDEYFDEDGIYESSINTSQHDLPNRLSSQVSGSMKKKPPNVRLPSDSLIMSSSTVATRPKHQLTHVSSQSSDDSSSLSRFNDRLEDVTFGPSPSQRPANLRQKLRTPSLPRLSGGRTSPSLKQNQVHQIQTPMALKFSGDSLFARSASPPLNRRLKGTQKPTSPPLAVTLPTQNVDAYPMTKVLQTTLRSSKFLESDPRKSDNPIMFGLKFIINEEEEDGEDDPSVVPYILKLDDEIALQKQHRQETIHTMTSLQE